MFEIFTLRRMKSEEKSKMMMMIDGGGGGGYIARTRLQKYRKPHDCRRQIQKVSLLLPVDVWIFTT